MRSFSHIPTSDELSILKVTGEMVLFEPFLLENPKTEDTFPEFDKEYYTMLEYTLYHLLYKFRKGWITSERQVIYTSDECISAVHFILDHSKEIHTINVFQRSSNLLNLKEDVQFFNYFIKKYANPDEVKLNIFVSAPHIFRNKKRKVED